MTPIFGLFLAFFACSGRFGKNGDFLAAQPPKRPFDRPVRWYLRYLRARDAQSATSPLVYVTPGGSNLPVCPKKRPRVPLVHTQNGRFPAPGARLLALGDPIATYEWVPIERFYGPPKSRAARRCAPKNNNFAQITKKKSPGGIELTTIRRPQQKTMGSQTMGLTILVKEPPYFPHLLVFFVVVWHVFAYQVPSQCATPGPWSWVAAWAPSVPGCQHTQPAQNKVPGGVLVEKIQ